MPAFLVGGKGHSCVVKTACDDRKSAGAGCRGGCSALLLVAVHKLASPTLAPLLQPVTWYDESGYCWCDMPDGWRYWWDGDSQQWQQHSQTPAGEGPAAQPPAEGVSAAEAPAAAVEAPAAPLFQQPAQEQAQAGSAPANDWADSFGLAADSQQPQQLQEPPAQPAPAADLADSFGLPPAAQHIPAEGSLEPPVAAAPSAPFAPPPAASWQQQQQVQQQPWQPSPSPEPFEPAPFAAPQQPWQPLPSPDAVSEQPSWQASASPDAAPPHYPQQQVPQPPQPPLQQQQQAWGRPPAASAPAVWRPSPSPSPSPDQLAPAEPAPQQWGQPAAGAAQQPGTFQPHPPQQQQPAAPFVPAAAGALGGAPAVVGPSYGPVQPGYGTAGGAAAGHSPHGRPAIPFGKLLFGGRVLLAAPSGKWAVV